ncbi:hypothetical protein [Oceanicola sp. 502str15]|uniref:hypothetical protein n=1 Tax=Oceanicola sp. 502str15 TaxID=2696061 RepID=UPI002095689B|nr:hypothetical protein [Oceanicola sp. 502str15]MCO6382236.1 hypothetical protein [Oceanicola sp. 502str15]
MRWLVIWAMSAGAALAAGPENGPELGFFEETYEMVGRGADGALMAEPLALRVQRRGLKAEGCAGPAGTLRWRREHESWRLKGRLFGMQLVCGYAVDAGNDPQLLCAGPGGVRLTGWPEEAFGEALACR